MAMAVAIGGRGGSGVPRRQGPDGGAARQSGSQGGWPAPGRAAAARGLAQSGPATCERRQAAARCVPSDCGAQNQGKRGRGGGVEHDEVHHYLESSREGAEKGRRREGRSSGDRVWMVDGGGFDFGRLLA